MDIYNGYSGAWEEDGALGYWSLEAVNCTEGAWVPAPETWIF
jgi:hypothetical protein